jgi:hypothetical protein
MFKRFLLFTSGLLVVLSGPPSRVLTEGEHSHAATAAAPVGMVETVETVATVAMPKAGFTYAFDRGNQEQ